MTEVRPGHDLEQVAIEGMRDAVCVGRAGAWWMQMIGIDAGADGVDELFEGVAADRSAAGVGSQVARDDFCRARDQGAEVSAAAKISSWVHLFRLTEIGIAARGILSLADRRNGIHRNRRRR